MEDIRKFGMIPEFIGRLPIIYTLEGLSEEMMVKILKEPKNAILKQYQKLLEFQDCKAEMEACHPQTRKVPDTSGFVISPGSVRCGHAKKDLLCGCRDWAYRRPRGVNDPEEALRALRWGTCPLWER